MIKISDKVLILKRLEELCNKNKVSMNKMLIESKAGERLYYNIKSGSEPSADKIEKIADYFNVSVDYILGRTNNPEINK